MTIAERLSLKAERMKRSRRALADGSDEDAVRAASYTLQEALGLEQLDMGLLDRDELAEAVRLAGKIRRVETAPVVPAARAAEVQRFVDGALALAERPETPPSLRANARLVAERARTTHRIPNEQERKTILSARPGATLQALRLGSGSGGEITARGINLKALDQKERLRLETIAEIAAGAEPGTIFAPRREQQQFRSKLAEVAAWANPGPRRRKRLDEPGALVLDGKALLADLLATNGEGTMLNIESVGVLVTLLLCIETRQLPAGTAPLARLVDDDNAIEVRPRCSPLGSTTLGGGSNVDFTLALTDLVRCRWLTTSKGGEGWTKITRGPRLLTFLEKREEVPA